MRKIAVEGINGAGKSPTIEKIVRDLRDADLATESFAPFHLVRSKLDIPDIHPLWQANPELAVKLLHDTIDEVEKEADQKNLDVLVYDRHWMTVLAQQHQVTDITELWGDRLVPSVLLTSPLAHSLRLTERGYSAPWLQVDTLEFYTKEYDRLYFENSHLMIGHFVVESADQDLQPIANNIVEQIINSKGVMDE